MHSIFESTTVFYASPSHPQPFAKAVENGDVLREHTELREFMRRVRDQSGNKVASLVWESIFPCLTADRSVMLQSSDTLRYVLSPAKHLPETAQRDHWLRIFDSRIVRP